MRRSGRRANSPLGISLFPFLAVLLCTMGALIVLLICLVQRAGVAAPPAEAVAAVASISPEELQELENAVDDASFVAGQLKQKKEDLSQSLAEIRDEMGIAERMLREQEDKAKLLHSQLAAFRHGDANEDARDAAKEMTEEVQSEIKALEAALREKETEQKDRPKRMSIIPYKGKNGTTQRPIYVECFADKVVIEPEGIVFTDEDFIALNSAGNPLDATLRAVREHFAKNGTNRGADTPYPLFIVRPGGDRAFHAAKAAIVSWEDEFGYELIDESVELDYPPPDAQLSTVLKRAANDARKRQDALAKALPGKFRLAGGGSGSANDGGGRVGGGHPIGGQSTSEQLSGPKGAPGATRLGGTGHIGDAAAVAAKRIEGHAASGADSSKKSSAGPIASIGGSDKRFLDGVAPKNDQRSRFSNSDDANEADNKERGGQPIRHGAAKSGDKNGVPGGRSGAAAMVEVQKRGKNWAHKSPTDVTDTAVTRTLAVRCTGSQIIFMPPKASPGKPIAIEWAGDPINVVDSIAHQVRHRIQSWGMAIGGGHWKPVLDVEVTPDGEQRFAELTAFFDQSGIEVRRKVR